MIEIVNKLCGILKLLFLTLLYSLDLSSASGRKMENSVRLIITLYRHIKQKLYVSIFSEQTLVILFSKNHLPM